MTSSNGSEALENSLTSMDWLTLVTGTRMLPQPTISDSPRDLDLFKPRQDPSIAISKTSAIQIQPAPSSFISSWPFETFTSGSEAVSSMAGAVLGHRLSGAVSFPGKLPLSPRIQNRRPSGPDYQAKQLRLRQALQSVKYADDGRPLLSYGKMLVMALQTTEGLLTLNQIYDWIIKYFPYYGTSNISWKNSIRHNLSFSRLFEKVPREPNDPGKGNYWRLSALGENQLLTGAKDSKKIRPRQGRIIEHNEPGADRQTTHHLPTTTPVYQSSFPAMTATNHSLPESIINPSAVSERALANFDNLSIFRPHINGPDPMSVEHKLQPEMITSVSANYVMSSELPNATATDYFSYPASANPYPRSPMEIYHQRFLAAAVATTATDPENDMRVSDARSLTQILGPYNAHSKQMQNPSFTIDARDGPLTAFQNPERCATAILSRPPTITEKDDIIISHNSMTNNHPDKDQFRVSPNASFARELEKIVRQQQDMTTPPLLARLGGSAERNPVVAVSLDDEDDEAPFNYEALNAMNEE